MITISIINSKGGVGKTTLTANIGAELAKRGNKVLLIDGDSQLNLTYSLIEPWFYDSIALRKTIRNVFAKFTNYQKTLHLNNLKIKPEKVNEHVNDNLSLVCAHKDIIKFSDLRHYYERNNKFTEEQIEVELKTILQKALRKIKKDYDYVLIDCPPRFGNDYLSQNALIASDFYLIPSLLDDFSLFGINQLITNIKELVSNFNLTISKDWFEKHEQIDPKLLGIVLNKVKYYNNELINSQNNYHEKLLYQHGKDIFSTLIKDYPSEFNDPTRTLLPMVLRSKVCQTEIINLVDELILRVEEIYATTS